MNEEEFEECSVVPYPHEIRFLHIKGGRISYCVDRHISDYVNKIQQENQKLKEMQCIFLGTGCQNKIKEYKNQQKEFIEYLENEIKRYRKTLSERPTNDLEYNNYKVTDVALEQIKIVLSKYKEIIGGKDK